MTSGTKPGHPVPGRDHDERGGQTQQRADRAEDVDPQPPEPLVLPLELLQPPEHGRLERAVRRPGGTLAVARFSHAHPSSRPALRDEAQPEVGKSRK